MNEVLRNFCEKNTNPNGLMILPMPTGSGKTYSVRNYIKELMERYPERKIFFISSQKKNIDDPYNELLEILPEHLKKRVCRVKSNAEALIDAKDKNIEFPKEIQKCDEYNKVVDCLFKANQNVFTSEEISSIEKNFRDVIKRYVKKNYEDNKLQCNNNDNYKKRLAYFKKNGKLHFITQIYPQCLFRDSSCQVLVMTMDKFISPFVTFVEPTFAFKDNKEALENAIVFIDEFDATKDTILNHITNNIKPIDLFRLFRDIHTALTQCHPPKSVTNVSENSEKHINVCRKLFDDIYNKYKLAYCFKLVDASTIETDKYFLFHDSGYRHLNGDDNQVNYKYNEKNESIELYAGKDTVKCKGRIEDILSEAEHAIQEFTHLCGNLSKSYYDRQKKDDFRMPLSDCRKTVLDSFHLSSGNINLIIDIINSYISGDNRSFVCGKTDSTVYTHGFSYYRFVDSMEHNENTWLAKYAMRESPESILISIASKAKVVGMSATAGVETLIANYDMKHIKWRLGGTFYELSEENETRLRRQFEESVVNYEQVDIEVEKTKNINDLPVLDKSKNIFQKRKQRLDYWSDLVGIDAAASIRQKFNSKDDFVEQRYWKVASVYRSFLNDEKLHSLLFFTNARLEPEIIEDVFSAVFKMCNITERTFDKKSIFHITSKDLYTTKKDLKVFLESGQKTVIISTYKTIGSGQNLQYAIPKCLEDEVVCINNYQRRKEKDIDAVYLEAPRHIIMDLSNPERYDDEDIMATKLKYIFIAESMAEPDNAEISVSAKYKQIGKVLFNNGNKERDPIRDTLSFYNAICTTLIQSVGRICRSNMKNKKVKLYVDSEIGGMFNASIILSKTMLFNNEFKALAELLKESGIKIKTEKQTKEERESTIATNASRRISSAIAKNFAVNFTNPKLKDFYINLGKYVLKHPTASFKDLELLEFKPLYNTLNTISNVIYYKQEGDFNKVNISFTPQTGYSSVSEGDVQLEDLFHAVPGLKEYFIENGYATSFEPNECIMTPPLFQNIYKGRLGEAVGKYVIENIAEIETEELPLNQFEILDSKLKGSNVFIDYKYWKESVEFDFEEYLKKMLDKLKACANEGAVVLVINARPIEGKYKTEPLHKDGYTLYEIPSIFEKTGDSSWRPSQSVIDLIKHLYDGNRTNSEL